MDDYESVLESLMREALSRHKIDFKEQVRVPVDATFYIMDFVIYGDYCKVIVECDGPHHYNHNQRSKDAIRDLWCIQNGFQDVLRFSAGEIQNQIEQCIVLIKQLVYKYDKILKDNGYLPIPKAKKSKKTTNCHSNYVGIRVPIVKEEPDTKSALSHQLQYTDAIKKLNTVSDNPDVTQQKRKQVNEEDLPMKDRLTFQVLKDLLPSDKKILWESIKRADKNSIAVWSSKIRHDVENLQRQGLLSIVWSHKGKIGILVLPNAPNLLNQLKGISMRLK